MPTAPSSLYRTMGPAIEASGGSAANTMAGVASLGGRGAFIGKVPNDQFGGVFRHDIRASGVAFDTASGRRAAYRPLPDLRHPRRPAHHADLSRRLPRTWARPMSTPTRSGCQGHLSRRLSLGSAAGRRRPSCRPRRSPRPATRSRSPCPIPSASSGTAPTFRDLVENHVDILFANEAEICSLWQTDSFDAALQATRGKCEVAALTRSAKGAVIVADDEVHVVDAAPVAHVVDTTGAGDLYAAGFLYGYTAGKAALDAAASAPSPPPR